MTSLCQLTPGRLQAVERSYHAERTALCCPCGSGAVTQLLAPEVLPGVAGEGQSAIQITRARGCVEDREQRGRSAFKLVFMDSHPHAESGQAWTRLRVLSWKSNPLH